MTLATLSARAQGKPHFPFPAPSAMGTLARAASAAFRIFYGTTAGGAFALGGVSDRPTDEKRMPLYEHVFLARQDLAQAQVDALAENATKILADNGGSVVKTETWGLKSLAYKIAKNRKAHYVMLDVDAPAAAIAELERQTNINEDVIRYMTIKVDELEKGPSAMMRRAERDRTRGSDRGDRGDRPDRGDRAPRHREEAGE